MAEIIQHEHRQKAGVRKTKKANLRVDLTPMVDLGFLLISFFVFTTTLSQPKAMTLKIPDDRNIKDSSEAPVSKTLNLILGAINQTYSYNGDDLNNIKLSHTQNNQLRSIIMEKKQELIKKFGSDSGMIVLIKPTSDAAYKDVVNALDEMLICNVKTYVLMDASLKELQAIKSYN